MKITIINFVIAVTLGTLTACKNINNPAPGNAALITPAPSETSLPAPTPTLTTEPPRVLTICSQEPASLFLYGDTSSAARSILQAVYDGPYDMLNFDIQPVIMANMPSVENGDVRLQPAEVGPGELIIDDAGNWVSLAEGVSFRPSGCTDSTCAQLYEGQEPVQMDVQVVVFRLNPGILWSDGLPLTAADSVYSFNVFKSLFQNAAPEVIRFTRSYTALDDLTVEWVGIPGYVGAMATKFFTPLPVHQLGGIENRDLLTAPQSSQNPMGWGPYTIDEWVKGDHVTLSRNPNYFRFPEGIPHFDHLVYRFMAAGDEAIDALVVGECDFIDRTLLFEEHIPRLQAEQDSGKLSFAVQTGTAWELAAFGIDTLKDGVERFRSVEVRRAIGMCIDRQRIADTLLFGISLVPDSYVPPGHPLVNGNVPRYAYDSTAAAELLVSAGWVDADGDPNTPRVSQGIADIPDGTPLRFTYLVPTGAERPEVARIVQEGLAGCGIQIEVLSQEWEALMSPGPDGPLFGRRFDMAQLAWSAAPEPACYLFTSDEIPGPLSEYPKGWGGANLGGYSNPQFDQLCHQALTTLPGSEAYREAHRSAQVIFAEDLPVIPLYQRIRLVAMRPDMCNVLVDPATDSALSHLELWDYGKNCGNP